MANERPYLLDVTRLVWRRWVGRLPTGIDRVCLAYLDYYRSKAQAVIQRNGFRRILSEVASDRLFDLLNDPGRNIKRELAVFFAGERLKISAKLAGRRRIYLNVGHTAVQDGGYRAWTRATDVRAVYMIHDLIPITHPEYCRAGEAQRHLGRVQNMLASAVGIIGNSEATLQSLAVFAAREAIELPKSIVAPLGTDVSRVSRACSKGSERPSFVMLGTIEARKNHLLMLEIWERLARSLGAQAPRLLIIGQRGWHCSQVFHMLDNNEMLRGLVEEISDCSDAELDVHLRGARALLFPTRVEGYGLPLIEALASGTPVIASDLQVFHEIGQEIPDFIDPLNAGSWENAILSYAREPSNAREAQLARLTAFRLPNWSDHFSKVDAWLATL